MLLSSLLGASSATTDKYVAVAQRVTASPSDIYTPTTPRLAIYPWHSGVGFGVPNLPPTTLSGNAISSVKFNTAKNVLAVGSGDWLTQHSYASNVFCAYPWDNVTGALGTRFSSPSTWPNSTYGITQIEFSPSDDTVFLSSMSAPFILAYQWSNTTGFGTKYSDPSSLPNIYQNYASVGFNRQLNLQVHPSGNCVAITTQSGTATNTPLFKAYPWSTATGFGTAYSNPVAATAIYDNIFGLMFTPSGESLLTLGTGDNARSFDFYANGGGFSSSNYPILSPSGCEAKQRAISNNAGDVIFFGNYNYYSYGSEKLVEAFSYTDSPFSLGTPFSSAVGMPTISQQKWYNFTPQPFYRLAIDPDDSTIFFSVCGAANLQVPKMYAFGWDNTSGWGAKYNDPSTFQSTQLCLDLALSW